MNAAFDTPYVSSNPPPSFDPLAPELAVAMTLHRTMDANAHTFDDPTVIALRLREFTLAAENGDLSHVRRVLANQMVMLERLFHHFVAMLPAHQTAKQDFERVAKLALRAQTQMARTAKVLQQLTTTAARAEKRDSSKAASSPKGGQARPVPMPNVESRQPERWDAAVGGAADRFCAAGQR